MRAMTTEDGADETPATPAPPGRISRSFWEPLTMDAAHKWGASFSIPTAVKESFRGLIRDVDAGRFAPGLFGSRDTQESTSFLIWAAGPPKWQNPLARLLAGLRFDIYPSNLAQLRDVEIKDVQRVADDERPQRRGRPPRGEQPVHPSVAQQVHADERVRAGDHSRDQGADLRRRVRPRRPGHPHMGTDQLMEPGVLGQREHRDQPRARDQVRVIETR
jgi:hypothetical protein